MKILPLSLSVLLFVPALVSCSKEENEKNLPISEDLDTSIDEEEVDPRYDYDISQEWADTVNGKWESTECINFEKEDGPFS